VLLVSAISTVASSPLKKGIINSKHDFRPTSSATIRAVTDIGNEEHLCIYCHAPHNSSPGVYLWNQQMSTTNFDTTGADLGKYSSSTLQSTVNEVTPADSSKLCLSCHDGTIALGKTITSGDVVFVQGSNYMLPSNSPSNLAGALNKGFTDDHPFAFVPSLQNPQIKQPPSDNAVTLPGGKLQCSSCHDPHNEFADPNGYFLVEANKASAICTTCHTPNGWISASHRTPTNPANEMKYTSNQGAHTGYIGVSNNACESCHKPHAPQVGTRLVKFQEEIVCYQCHNGTVASTDVQTEFTKQYVHPVAITPSVHDEAESPSPPMGVSPMPEINGGAQRHAECVDCHNPHASNPLPANPPAVSGAIAGVRGQSITNAFLLQSSNEYETCFKCHGESANKPQMQDITLTGTGYGRNPQRQADFAGGTPNMTRANTRLEFTTRPSYHPVTMARNLSTGVSVAGAPSPYEVPSLRQYMIDSMGTNISTRPLNASSQIYCMDCHNDSSSRMLGASSMAPNGPHGSIYPHILERSYLLEAAAASPGTLSAGVQYQNQNTYALCDKCHDITNSVLTNQSFTYHSTHVINDSGSCSTCHDAHSSNQAMLINFDLAVVGPSTSAHVVQFVRTAQHHGTCTLMCHGHDHAASSY
jgi:predicted CXXCH cytochrome family protein